MQKVSTRLSAITGTVALLILSSAPALAVAPSVYAAHGADDSTTTTTTSTNETENETETAEPTTTSDDSSTHRNSDTEAERLAAQKNAKLKVCQNHERVVTNIMTRIADRGQRRLDVMTTIAERVEAFYVSKGKTLSNYDSLVADVNTKKAAAQDAVNAVKAGSTSFSCDSSSPSNSVSSFRTALKAEQSALEAYHKSVRNLIVGVKSVTGTTSSSNESTSGGNQ